MVTYFFQSWNGCNIFRHPAVSYLDVNVQTDASGTWDCAAVLNAHWASVAMASRMA